MGRTILIAIGFFFSFMLGSLFTAAYMEVDNTNKTEKIQYVHGEKSSFKVVEPSAVVISSAKIGFVPKGTVLREVTVSPAKALTTLTGYVIEAKKQCGLKSLSHFNVVNTNYNPIPRNRKTWEPLTTIKEINGPEAKARSPGTKLVPVASNNFINHLAMLRSEKKALKNILKLIYANKRYVRIKNNGDIIIKEHWYSQDKIRTTWSDIFNVTVPGVIVGLSKDIAENYFQELVELQNKGKTDFQLIKFVEKHFADFCLETGFSGKTVIKNLEPASWKKSFIRIHLVTEEKINNIKQINLHSLLSRYFPTRLDNRKFSALQSLPSKSIISLQDVLDSQVGDFSLHSVGLCTSGIPNVDATWPKVFRLTETTDLI